SRDWSPDVCSSDHEQPPAARAEPRIAAEQGAVTDVRDVSRCVSRDIQHLEAQIELRERSCVSFPQRSRLTGYVFPRRAEYRHAVRSRQCLHAADMVGVSMRDEDARELELPIERGFDRVREI